MFSSNIEGCDISGFGLSAYNWGYSAYSWSNIQILKEDDASLTYLKVPTGKGFNEEIYIYSNVKNAFGVVKYSTVSLRLNVVVCGKEVLRALDGVSFDYQIIQTNTDRNETIKDKEIKE